MLVRLTPIVHCLVTSILLLLTPQSGLAEGAVFAETTSIAVPVGPGAREPALFALSDGRVAMSWTEIDGTQIEVRFALLDGDKWDGPHTVHSAADLFINWADFPKVAVLGDGTIAVHWLTESGRGSYDYDVNISLSRDGGESWSAPIVPHSDKSVGQHGFVSLLPVGGDRLAVIWLDGRAYGHRRITEAGEALPDAMQLRATVMKSNGAMDADVPVDSQVCSCCQTSAALAGDGSLLVAYRDRTDQEIRDISVARMKDGLWAGQVSVHADGWEISGCPVNGPAIDIAGTRAVVVWFTGADGIPAVKVAFSDDTGLTFGPATRIDMGEPAGRVDLVVLDDGSALVSWIEWLDDREALMVCRIGSGTGCAAIEPLISSDDDITNFPQMVRSGADVYFAWTQPLDDAGSDTTVRILRARLARTVLD